MSYTTIHRCANDAAFMARLSAAAAQEGQENPEFVMSTLLRWPVSARSDVEEAYEYAINADNPNPGGDDTVITDGMILAAVQSILSPPPPDNGLPVP